MFARWLQRQWFDQRRLSPALWLLLPLCGLFVLGAALKRRLTTPQRLSVPVIVVGNITVGGAGKTPLTAWLAKELASRGWHPGIVSRGYGRKSAAVMGVTTQSTASEVGDEPLLLARQTRVPVWVGRQRAEAGRALLAAHPDVDVVLCDDGLQHAGLARDVELAVCDARGIGNGWRLPIGPLREPVMRLATVDAKIGNNFAFSGLAPTTPEFPMTLQAKDFYRLGAEDQTCSAATLAASGRCLHAVAGIGHPERFFATLTSLGLSFVSHPFPDHHAFTPADLAFGGDGIVLMTEKDAVKCAHLTAGEIWVLPVEAVLSPALIDLIVEKLRGRQAA